jgi:hypothetical protein
VIWLGCGHFGYSSAEGGRKQGGMSAQFLETAATTNCDRPFCLRRLVEVTDVVNDDIAGDEPVAAPLHGGANLLVDPALPTDLWIVAKQAEVLSDISAGTA